MKNELANKVMAFAKIFGLNISSWKDNGTSINFYYNNNILVGSISLENSEFRDDAIAYCGYYFNLYTSIGRVHGIYDLKEDTFHYSFARVNYNTTDYKKTYGFTGNLMKDGHFITLVRANYETHVKVIMTNTSIEIERRNNEGIWDTFNYYGPVDNSEAINVGFNYIKGGHGNVFGEAKMSIEENKDNASFYIHFKFLKEKYTMKVKYNGNTFAEKLQSIDFNDLMEEIKRECPYFLNFVNSIKEELSFTYYGDKKINLYDIIANLSFANVDNLNYIISLAGQDTEPEPKLKRKI